MPLSVTVGAFQTTRPSGCSMFVMKLNPAASGLDYATYLGATDISNFPQTASAIAIDSDGAAYVTGTTIPGYPTTPGAYQTTATGNQVGFVTKLSADGGSGSI